MNVRAGEGYGDDDRLPWLESVEEDYREGSSIWRILLLIVLVAAVIGAGVFGWYWYQRQQGMTGNGELIAAQEGDYKVRPDEPGGMKVEGQGDVTYPTSEGDTSNASIDVEALPETPIEGKKAGTPKAADSGAPKVSVAVPTAAPKATPTPRVPVVTATRAAGTGGAVIQLGAFPDQGGANAAWTRLTKRYDYLAALGKSVEKGTSGSATVWRLRVNTGSNDQAREICGKLKLAGENCYVAN